MDCISKIRYTLAHTIGTDIGGSYFNYTTADKFKLAAIVAGVVAGISLAIAGVALAVILGAPILTALASLALPTLIGAALVSALSLTALGLLVDSYCFFKPRYMF